MRKPISTSLAAILGSGHFDIATRRPFVHTDGRSYCAHGKKLVPVNNALLQYQEWLDIDRVVIEAAVERLVGVSALISKGLVHNLGSIGLTISQWDRASDLTEATVSMSGVTEGQEGTVDFEEQGVPVPVVHSDWRLNLRRLEASRLTGESLDMTMARMAGRVVAEKSETILFAGASVKSGGNSLYGYTNHPHRNTVDMSKQWTDNTKTAAEILTDVQNMLAAARGDNHFGPFSLYVPGEYEGVLDNDYDTTTATGRTIRQRILQLSGISEIVVADKLSNHNVVLVELTADVVDMAIAQDINTVQWESKGGMEQHFKTFAVWAPRIKSHHDGKSGVVHLYDIP